MPERRTTTIGELGLRYHSGGTLLVGQSPIITQHADREDVNGNAIGPRRPVLDMQPTMIGFAELLQALIDQNDKGLATHFLGHVYVIPTSKDDTVSLTDSGQVVVGQAD